MLQDVLDEHPLPEDTNVAILHISDAMRLTAARLRQRSVYNGAASTNEKISWSLTATRAVLASDVGKLATSQIAYGHLRDLQARSCSSAALLAAYDDNLADLSSLDCKAQRQDIEESKELSEPRRAQKRDRLFSLV